MDQELHDLRDPLTGPSTSHPGTLALPSTLLSWGSCVSAMLVLVALEIKPAWRPDSTASLVAVLLGLVLAMAVAWAGHRRAGPVFPRAWALFLTLACALTASLLVFGSEALQPTLTAPALALLAAAAALMPRLERRRLVPHHRRLLSVGLTGPILGLAIATALGLWGASSSNLQLSESPKAQRSDNQTLRQSEPRLARERISLCLELERAWLESFDPLAHGEQGERLDHLEVLEKRLSATPPVWPELMAPEKGTELLAACAPVASVLRDASVRIPVLESLVDPAFEHRPRPESAGELVRDLPRDPGPLCRLHGVLASTAEAFAIRFEAAESASARGLRRSLEIRRTALAGDWLDGWLSSCSSGDGLVPRSDPALSLESTLASPPGLEAGRPDLWLGLTLRDARALAARIPACALRPSYEDRQRRWQAFDCVLIGPSRHDGSLAILAELGLVYASPLGELASEALPAIPDASAPATMRLLIDDDGEGDFHRRAIASLRALESALAAAGTRLDPPPGDQVNDSAAWRFGLRFVGGSGEASAPAIRLDGTISRRILPGGREGTLFVLRRAKD